MFVQMNVAPRKYMCVDSPVFIASAGDGFPRKTIRTTENKIQNKTKHLRNSNTNDDITNNTNK